MIYINILRNLVFRKKIITIQFFGIARQRLSTIYIEYQNKENIFV